MIGFIYNDGGRAAAGFKGETDDCVIRAISIASDISYMKIRSEMMIENDLFRKSSKCRAAKSLKSNSAFNGVFKGVYNSWLLDNGWKWVPTMQFGKGCQVHLRADELPPGRLIVQVSKHLTCVIDSVLNDTYDCSRNGRRCVYGYYIPK